MGQFRRTFCTLLVCSLLVFVSACTGSPTISYGRISSATPGGTPTPNPDQISFNPHPFILSPTPTASSVAGTLPAGFPRYFSFGVVSDPGSLTTLDAMRAENGTAFAFRYQSLSDGVNTGHGWETWSQPLGDYAVSYMRESSQHGYIPAFAYYEMCQSNGPRPGSACGSDELAQDTGNLANADVMHAYFANWVLLLQKIKAYGKLVLVIVEPDLWGHLQSAAQGSDDAARVPASVSASGYADAAGFPNTAQGFAWALLHMRDVYAPNALLALHASTWGSGPDVATSTSPDLDVKGLARREVKFLNSVGLVGTPPGVSSWDLLSNDLADSDAGQPGSHGWWDRYNRTFPNFARYLDFINTLYQATHRRIVLWQVPLGNQYFSSMNNTPGHYQDNRAEYILNNVASFANVGVIAVLFGSGSHSGTLYTDKMHDGVTNAASISSYECDHCNSQTSHYPDDDGGYLRLFIGHYMTHPFSLNG